MPERLSNASLIAATMAYMIVVGADLFGQLVLIPMTFSEPPRSLFMYHGPVPYDSEPFWQTLTMIVTALALIAVVTNWAKPRRYWVLGFFVAWFILNAISFAFIFPEYQAIQSVPYADHVDPELLARAEAQEFKAGIRAVIAILIAVIPFVALTLPLSKGADAPGERPETAPPTDPA